MTDIPRAYSTAHPDFNPDLGQKLKIFVNGIEQQKVIGYDIDAGRVLRYEVDERGNCIVDRIKQDVMTEEVFGEVTVTMDA